MRIGIIGAGHIGGTLARRFVDAGHQVAISNSRGPDTLRDQVAELGPQAEAVTAAEAERFGDVVVLAVPFGAYRDVPIDGVAGKIVVDATNYYPDRDGHVDDLDTDATTSSELIARHLPGAQVVKAFNALYWNHLRDRGRPNGDPDRIGVPISGDDARAKDVVAALVDDLGFDSVDAGPLASGGRKHQPGTPVYTADLRTNQLYAELA